MVKQNLQLSKKKCEEYWKHCSSYSNCRFKSRSILKYNYYNIRGIILKLKGKMLGENTAIGMKTIFVDNMADSEFD